MSNILRHGMNSGSGETVPIPKKQFSDAVFPTCTYLGHVLETRDSRSWLRAYKVGVVDNKVDIKINITRLGYIIFNIGNL